jgi:hypothetical protein
MNNFKLKLRPDDPRIPSPYSASPGGPAKYRPSTPAPSSDSNEEKIFFADKGRLMFADAIELWEFLVPTGNGRRVRIWHDG